MLMRALSVSLSLSMNLYLEAGCLDCERHIFRLGVRERERERGRARTSNKSEIEIESTRGKARTHHCS